MSTNNSVSQKEILGGKLMAIKDDVTREDRVAYQNKNIVSRQLVFVYFKGEVMDADRGVDMLEFFTKRIAERNAKIASIEKIK